MTQASTSVHHSKNHPQHSVSSNQSIPSISTRSTTPFPPTVTISATSPSRGSSHSASILQKLCCFLSPRTLSLSSSSAEKKRGLPDAPERAPLTPASAESDIDVINNAGITTAPRWSEEEFEKVFRYFDENGDGKISPSELRSCMRAVGEELSAEDAVAVMESTDSDGDGLLGFDDFVKLVDVGGEEEKARDLKEAFSMYEMRGQGCITPKSLRRMLRRLGEQKTIEECEVMIRQFDRNGDGVLSFDEFKLMML